MTYHNASLRNRIIKIMNEEFKDNTERLKQDAVEDFVDTIIGQLMVKKLGNDEIREELKNAFKKYFEDDVEIDFIKASDQKFEGNEEYNEYLERFKVIFTQIDAPLEQKTELFNTVASINNFGMYYVMLFRSLSNAIFDTTDPATANLIMARAVKEVENQTNIIFSNAESIEDVEKKPAPAEQTTEKTTNYDNVVDFQSKISNQ